MANNQPIDNRFKFEDGVANDASAAVYIRQNWWDDWTYRDDLVCTNVSWVAAPNVGSCTLHYRYGPTMERDGTTLVRPKLSIDGWYVRVIVTCDDGERRWHGFVDDTGDEPAGYLREITQVPLSDPPEFETEFHATGKQTFACVDMLAALDRSPLQSCYLQTTNANEGEDLDDMRVCLSAPWFNPMTQLTGGQGQRRQIPNRANLKSEIPDFSTIEWGTTGETYIFAWRGIYNIVSANEQYWTPRDMVEYLLAYHAPRDKINESRIPLRILEEDLETIPDWGQPEINCDGLSLKEALDRILSIRGSLGYWVWVDDELNEIRIEPFTILSSSLTVGVDKTIAANTRQLDIHAVGDPATSTTLQRAVTTLANQIVVRGAKRIVVLSLPLGTAGRFANGWTTADVTAYNAAVAAITGAQSGLESEYAARDLLEQPRFRHIYRNFVLSTSWDWKTRDGSTILRDVFRADSIDSSLNYPNDNARYLPFPSRVRILPHIPLKESIDYSTGDKATEHAESSKQFRRIELWGRSHGADYVWGTGDPVGRPINWCERAKRDVAYDVKDPDYSLYAMPLDNDQGLGIAVNVNGAAQTALSGGDAAENVPGIDPVNLTATFAIEEDRYVEQSWPSPASLPDVDGILRRVFDFGDQYQLIELLEGTIVGVTATEFLKRDEDTFIRDDRPLLLEIAKQLHRWYSVARNILRISSRRTTSRLWPGQLVKKLNPGASPGSNPHEAIVDCVITEVSLTLPIGDTIRNSPIFNVVTTRGDMDPLFYQPRLS